MPCTISRSEGTGHSKRPVSRKRELRWYRASQSENSLACVGSHGGTEGPMAEVTRPRDTNHPVPMAQFVMPVTTWREMPHCGRGAPPLQFWDADGVETPFSPPPERVSRRKSFHQTLRGFHGIRGIPPRFGSSRSRSPAAALSGDLGDDPIVRLEVHPAARECAISA